jgi:TonB-dependent SusC/RagA subfamily outer membrane receptor
MRAVALSTVFLLTASVTAAQQTGQVGVRAMNAQTGEPISAVQISVLNTGIGGLTDNQGRLTLSNVPVGQQTIVAQLIGFGEERERVTVAAGQLATVQVRMSSRAVELEGLVVTGTAIAAQRREVGNSISLITSDQIRNAAAINFEDILRGRALGVSVSGSTGTAGAGSEIILRGVQSVNGRNDPLIYVDGVRIPSGQAENNNGAANEHATLLGSINPEDIERIEVIKGAAASTLYGTEAAAGVIQIFTKKGQAGDPRWTLSVKQGLSRIGHIGPEMDPTGLHVNDCTRSLVFDSVALTHRVENLREPGCPSSGSWLRDGHVQDYQLSVRGGAGDISYYASGGWNNSQGVVDPQGAKQLSLRANFTFTGLPNLTFNLNTAYSRRDIRWISNGDSDQGLLFNVTRGDRGDTPDNDDSKVLDL